MSINCIQSTRFLPLDDYQLQKNRVDIWEIPLGNLPSFAATLLNKDEIERANRFYFERHKRRFTLARALMRLIISRYLQIEPKELRFEYNAQGKPQLYPPKALEFNLSHSQNLALLAIGKEAPLGIDLEFFSDRPYDGIAKHLFSDQEIKSFLPLADHLKPLSFFHIWAQKEAFIKACGLGLSYPTNSFTVPISSPTHELIYDPLNCCEWQIHSFMPKISCSAALCCHPRINFFRYRSVTDPEAFYSLY